MFRVGVDIGGTFTDCVIQTPEGKTIIVKSPSTPGNFAEGFMNVLKVAADRFGLGFADFLGKVSVIVHGTTVSTNALVTRRTARTGLMATRGHPDVLTLREAPRKKAWDWRLDYPDPFVPRNLTMEVGGRIDSLGNEIEPLSEQDVRAAARRFRQAGVEAIAVSLLWAFVNPSHEVRVAAIIEEEWPGVPVSLGHQVNPIPREYRRTIATAIDASLRPVVNAYVDALTGALASAGFGGKLLIANCTGGMMPPDEIIASPIQSVMSGPTMAPVAARYAAPDRDVVVADMGGTTFDVAAIRSGQILVTPEAMIYDHDMLGLPKVDVRSVGAGGGSIAWVDDGGLLHVGPQSAGARPGPACYGLGGDMATVTDANVVLGIIDPDFFLGGAIRLDRALAEQAVDRIAGQLRISRLEAAYAIHATSNHNMIGAIEDITVNEGLNPRDSLIVTGGGATGCHIAGMAQALGLPMFMVPRLSSGLSAFGGLVSDIRWQATASAYSDSSNFAFDRVNQALLDLTKRCTAFLDRSEISQETRTMEVAFMGRYQFQSWEIEVPFRLPESGAISTANLSSLTKAFHDVHRRVYGIANENDRVEFVSWKMTAVGRTDRQPAAAPPLAGSAMVEPAAKGSRSVCFEAGAKARSIPVYNGGSLPVGAGIHGPAVIEEETTTLLLLPGMTARVDIEGNYWVECA
ncbi:MAG: hydantoinase/oxoprolinase family protein [Mesorhizobium sp.]|nr:hydantoinase/oxoprolinase family protein [Mesorhizobium sp.]MBL8577602.1 hydantoinase/oxoprolinase family protein [Mesorhizobium sp.]